MWSERASSWDYVAPSSLAIVGVAGPGRPIIAANEGRARWTSRPGWFRRAVGSMLVCVRPQPECRAQAGARSAADRAYRAAGLLLRSVLDAQQPGSHRNDVDLRARRFKRAIEILASYRNPERASAEIMGALLRPATSSQLCRLKAGLVAVELGTPLSGRAGSKPGTDSVGLGGGFLVMACVLEHLEAEFARRITRQPLLDAAGEFERGSVPGAARCMVRLANSLAMFTADSSERQYLVSHGINALPACALRLLARGFSSRAPLPNAASPLQRIVAETCGAEPADPAAARHADLLRGVQRALETAITRHVASRLPDATSILRVGCRFPEQLERSLEDAWDICEDAIQAVAADHIGGVGGFQPAHRLMLKALAMAGPAAALLYPPLMTDKALQDLVAAAASSGEPEGGNDLAHSLRREQSARLAKVRQIDHANLSAAVEVLGRALLEQDKTAIANGLARLQPFRKAFCRSSTRAGTPITGEVTPPDPGGDTLQLRVNEVMGKSVSMLHSPDDGIEPIGPVGLRQLSNSAIADLRRAVAHAGGEIVLKDEYLVPELRARGLAFAQQVQQNLRHLVSVLAGRPVQPDDLVLALAAATQAAMAHIERLSQLGDEVAGSDALADYAVEQVEHALTGMQDDALVRAAAGAVEDYVGLLQQALQSSRHEVANVDDEEALVYADPLLHALNMLSIGGMLLHALATRLDPACDTLPDLGNVVAAGKLGVKGLGAFAAGFGVRLNTGAATRSPLVLDRVQAASLHEALTVMPDAVSGMLVPLDLWLADGASRTIRVDSQFYQDAVQRPSVSFSFCKAGREQDVTRYVPEHGHPAGTLCGGALGEALWRLYEMAGDKAVTLTRVMSQQLAAGLITALAGLGTRSPVTLEDGSCFLPGGPGRLHFDLHLHDDGSWHIVVSISFKDLETGTRLAHPAAVSQSMVLVPDLSHFIARFAMVLQPNGRALRMAKPVMLDYEVVENTAGY